MRGTYREHSLLMKLTLLGLIVALMSSMATAALPRTAEAAGDSEIVFQRDASNRPVFDGVAGHLDAFVDLILSDMSIEDLAYYADQKSAGSPRTIQAGYELPGTAAGGVDRVMGVSTDMPSMLALGQSWNKELVNEVGTVIGNERRGEVNLSDPNTLMYSAVSDMRTNPLSGRYEEGYGEDPVLAGTLVNEMAKGITGYGEDGNEDGFWLKAQLGTKHYTNYLAQWFRQSGQFDASARALNEYQLKSFLYPLQAGTVQSLMTTYGRTNGIPNHISPNIIRAANANPYNMISVGDFIFADNNMTAGFNNGYQNYTDAEGKAALLLLSGNHANAFGSTQAAIVSAVTKGAYGVTRKELEDNVRGQIEMWVRTGYFNEKNEDGSPKSYPFSELAKDRSPENYAASDSQSIALDASRESIVLLKNDDDVLPLDKSNKVAVTGLLADTRFKATYSVSATPSLPDAGLSPLGAIREAIGEDNVAFGTGAPIVAFESAANGLSVSAAVYTAGAQVAASYEAPAEGSVTDSVYAYKAEGKAYTASEAFEAYAWGQEGYSFLSQANGKWLKSETNGTIANSDATTLNLKENPFSNVADASTLPGRFRVETNADGTVSLISGTYTESFGGGFETAYYTAGKFVKTNASGALELAATPLTNAAGAAARTSSEKFREIVLKEAGADAQAWATDNDYAVVVVGTPARHSSGEGADRSDLNLGDDQYKIVSEVAEAFPKKTIVIVKANAPVNLQEIQDNDNVAAILYQPYAGQYDSKALADVLFGDYAPTGRLVSTWYAGTESFPALNAYSLPPAASSPTSLSQIDPRFTVDMTNGDPAESGLTYMYTDADVTYPFGYGLSYSRFEYSKLAVPASASGDQPFTVTVDVTNAGAVDTSEVVQLYVRNDGSSYGAYVPKKQLVSYGKVFVEAGATKTIELTVDPSDFAVWDVNRGSYVTETGTYTLLAGRSSEDLPLTATLRYSGSAIATLDATTAAVNVFDHAFASNDTVYREVSKLRTAEGLKAKQSENGYYAVMSKSSGSWVALNGVNLTGAKGIKLRGASTNATSVVEVRADSPTGTRLAVLTFDATEAATRDVPGSDFEVVELDYANVEENLLASVSGTHNLYLVFKNADVRVDSIQLIGSTSTGGGSTPSTPTTPDTDTGTGTDTDTGTGSGGSGTDDGSDTSGSEEPGTDVPATVTFKDVGASYSWAAEAIAKLSAEGIIKGTSSTTFEPAKPVTRADFVLLLARAFKLTADQAAGSFSDVPENAYYAEAVAIAKSLGIVQGSGGKFDPLASIARQDMMVLIARVLQASGKLELTDDAPAELDAFADAGQVANYAKSAVAALVKAGIVQGDGSRLNPKGITSRAEAAVILYRIYRL
ncbi:glycoside hydrolase family 3 C-terminal domain-containing protein [Cohnella fermenti]|nr:glycoside hydrolase family 3 C-terminal domain-containing protein [Cohnella fermenti]